MALYEKKNNAIGTVNDDPLAAGATTLNLQSGEGANFPASGVFLITVWDNAAYPNPGDDPNMEIMRVTSRSSDALTVVRAQESTGDAEHAQGQRVEMLITAGIFTDSTYGLDAKLSVEVSNETPTGTINGTNKEFTLAQTPSPATSLILVRGRAVMIQGTDYTLAANTITYTVAPPTGTIHRAWYRY